MSGAESRRRALGSIPRCPSYLRYTSRAAADRTSLRARICRFRKWEAIPFLTHEHMLYRLKQLLQAEHAEVSMCKMGSFGAIGRHCILNSARF
jgi:hypothetical protein